MSSPINENILPTHPRSKISGGSISLLFLYIYLYIPLYSYFISLFFGQSVNRTLILNRDYIANSLTLPISQIDLNSHYIRLELTSPSVTLEDFTFKLVVLFLNQYDSNVYNLDQIQGTCLLVNDSFLYLYKEYIYYIYYNYHIYIRYCPTYSRRSYYFK